MIFFWYRISTMLWQMKQIEKVRIFTALKILHKPKSAYKKQIPFFPQRSYKYCTLAYSLYLNTTLCCTNHVECWTLFLDTIITIPDFCYK